MNQTSNDRAARRLQPERRRAASAAVALALAGASTFAVVHAVAQTGAKNYFQLYVADRGSSQFKPTVTVGPLPSVGVCYGTGALLIEQLNYRHPDKDFRGRCENGILLSLSELSFYARELLPKE